MNAAVATTDDRSGRDGRCVRPPALVRGDGGSVWVAMCVRVVWGDGGSGPALGGMAGGMAGWFGRRDVRNGAGAPVSVVAHDATQVHLRPWRTARYQQRQARPAPGAGGLGGARRAPVSVDAVTDGSRVRRMPGCSARSDSGRWRWRYERPGIERPGATAVAGGRRSGSRAYSGVNLQRKGGRLDVETAPSRVSDVPFPTCSPVADPVVAGSGGRVSVGWCGASGSSDSIFGVAASEWRPARSRRAPPPVSRCSWATRSTRSPRPRRRCARRTGAAAQPRNRTGWPGELDRGGNEARDRRPQGHVAPAVSRGPHGAVSQPGPRGTTPEAA